MCMFKGVACRHFRRSCTHLSVLIFSYPPLSVYNNIFIIIFMTIHVQNDIYFATTAPEFFHGKMERLQMDQQKAERDSMSPPASPHCKYKTFVCIFLQNKWLARWSLTYSKPMCGKCSKSLQISNRESKTIKHKKHNPIMDLAICIGQSC